MAMKFKVNPAYRDSMLSMRQILRRMMMKAKKQRHFLVVASMLMLWHFLFVFGHSKLMAHEFNLLQPHTHLEILPLMLVNDDIQYWHPKNAQALTISCIASQHPNEQVESVMKKLGFQPLLIHSTSWRFDQGVLTLTYLVLVNELTMPQQMNLKRSSIEPASIVHGTAIKAPKNIALKSVIYHAITHLSWLSMTDEPVKNQLSQAWKQALKKYIPEPFLQLY
jgi:hypothetical protein